MAAFVLVPNLGNEFDLGAIEANKIHILTDSSIVRDPVTGALSVNPAGVTITHSLSLAGTVLSSEVNGVTVQQDLAAAITAGETLTVLGYDPITTMLSYTDEHGNVSAIDLSALTADIYVNGATYDANALTLTLTDNDGATPDVVVDLSTLKVTVTDNGDNTYTLTQGASSYTIDTKDGVSSDAGNLLTLGADQKPNLQPAAVTGLATIEVVDAFSVHLGWILP